MDGPYGRTTSSPREMCSSSSIMRAKKEPAMDFRVEIVGERVNCWQASTEVFSMPLKDFMAAMADRMDYLSLPEAIPDGVTFLRRRGDAMALVLQEKPQVRTVRWLAEE